MVNVEFLIVSYIVSMFVDWVFQRQWQAKNKSKWSNFKDADDFFMSYAALTTHAFEYALYTSIILGLFIKYDNSDIIFIVLFISHIIIDTRIPVKLIMKLKGMTNKQINDYQNYGFMHIGIDNRLN